MRISFDIDNTLIPYSDEFQVEEPKSILNFYSNEKLRIETSTLFKKLQADKHEIWIYTTSFRSIRKLKLIFLKYGLFPNGFINQKINQRMLDQHKSTASKNPKLFNIDLHIDDSPGVKIEGERLGFKVLIIDPIDVDWTNKILSEILLHKISKG